MPKERRLTYRDYMPRTSRIDPATGKPVWPLRIIEQRKENSRG